MIDMPDLQKPEVFLNDFIFEVNSASKSIYLQSMNFETGKILDQIVPPLIDALKRGVKIYLNIDWISLRYVGEDLPIIPPFNREKRLFGEKVHAETRQIIQKLQEAGAKVTFTNVPSRFASLLPIVGRNHIKMYVIDEKVAWLGGVNLFDFGFQALDFLVKFTDAKLISELIQQHPKVNKLREKFDYSTICSDDLTLYIDTGIRNRSLIYDSAVELLKSALHSAVFMSQMVPEGRILEELITLSNKGVKVSVVTSTKQDLFFTKFPYKLRYSYFKNRIRNKANIHFFHLKGKVHTKLILVDEKSAMFGSHNFVDTGVMLGTGEIAVKTTDPQLLALITAFYRQAVDELSEPR